MAKLNKREVIKRLIILPKTQRRPFWAREMKMLNTLMEEFIVDEFWQKVNFPEKFDSLAYFINKYGKRTLRRKYNEYNYKLPEIPVIVLTEKKGEDKSINRQNRTVKDFFK